MFLKRFSKQSYYIGLYLQVILMYLKFFVFVVVTKIWFCLSNLQNDYKVKHFRKIYFDVWDLKLEILTCFDVVLCHLHGVTT